MSNFDALSFSRDPLVSVAIPTFNRASWLSDCVSAALAQSYERLEVLVSDNASTDETAKVLKTFHDPRLRVVTQQSNIGLLPNWNACLANARGDYVFFVSDDDTIAPWLLERCIALVRSAPQIPIVIALSDYHYATQGRRLPAITSRKLGTGIWDGIDILGEFFEGRITAAMCTIMFRVETFRARGGFPTDLHHVGDTAAWAPLLLTGKAGLVNESCGTYHVHSVSQTSKFDLDTRLAEFRKLIDLITNMAEWSVDDLQRCRRIKLQARRYLMFVIINLAYHERREGTSLAKVLPLLGRWRRELIAIELSDIARLARPLSYILLPTLMTRLLRCIFRTLKPRGKAVQTTDKPAFEE